MNSAEPLTPGSADSTVWYFIGDLKQTLILNGQISRRDWDRAVDAANRYTKKLAQESDGS